MKRNVFACGALVLGMVAGFVVRGTLESADAIPPQTQASACSETSEVPKLESAVRDTALENGDEYQVFLQVTEKTAAGYSAARLKEKETELLPEPMHRVSIANMDFGACSLTPISSPSRIQDERWDVDVKYAITWDAAQGWFDYGPFKPRDYDSVFHCGPGLALYR
jgi:hypothetical protein